MPNWCSNVLRIKGDPEELKKFDKKFKGFPSETAGEHRPTLRKYCFNALYPLPKREANNWYDWCIEHWGTKWDVYGEVDKTDTAVETELEYFFETAWAPPEKWLEYVSHLFPMLDFELTYWEPGCNFAGRMQYVDGEVGAHDECTYENAHDLLESVGHEEDWDVMMEAWKEAEEDVNAKDN